jgi:hypothetical protein
LSAPIDHPNTVMATTAQDAAIGAAKPRTIRSAKAREISPSRSRPRYCSSSRRGSVGEPLAGSILALLKIGWVGAGVWAWRERRPRLANECGARPGPSRAWPAAPACGGCGLDEVLTVRPAGRHAVYGRDRAGAAFACTHGPSKSLHIRVLPFVRRAAGVSNPRAARGCGTPFVPTTPVEHRAQGRVTPKGAKRSRAARVSGLTDRARCYAR